MTMDIRIHPESAIDFASEIHSLDRKNIISGVAMTVAAVAAVAISIISVSYAISPMTPLWIVIPLEIGAAIALEYIVNKGFVESLHAIQERNVERVTLTNLKESTERYISEWGSFEDAKTTLATKGIAANSWDAVDLPEDEKKLRVARLLSLMDDAKTKKEASNAQLIETSGKHEQYRAGIRETYRNTQPAEQRTARETLFSFTEKETQLTHAKAVWKLYEGYFFSILCQPHSMRKIDSCLAPRLLSHEEQQLERSTFGDSPFISDLQEAGITAENLREETILNSTLPELKEKIFDHVITIGASV